MGKNLKFIIISLLITNTSSAFELNVIDKNLDATVAAEEKGTRPPMGEAAADHELSASMMPSFCAEMPTTKADEVLTGSYKMLETKLLPACTKLALIAKQVCGGDSEGMQMALKYGGLVLLGAKKLTEDKNAKKMCEESEGILDKMQTGLTAWQAACTAAKAAADAACALATAQVAAVTGEFQAASTADLATAKANTTQACMLCGTKQCNEYVCQNCPGQGVPDYKKSLIALTEKLGKEGIAVDAIQTSGLMGYVPMLANLALSITQAGKQKEEMAKCKESLKSQTGGGQDTGGKPPTTSSEDCKKPENFGRADCRGNGTTSGGVNSGSNGVGAGTNAGASGGDGRLTAGGLNADLRLDGSGGTAMSGGNGNVPLSGVDGGAGSSGAGLGGGGGGGGSAGGSFKSGYGTGTGNRAPSQIAGGFAGVNGGGGGAGGGNGKGGFGGGGGLLDSKNGTGKDKKDGKGGVAGVGEDGISGAGGKSNFQKVHEHYLEEGSSLAP